MEYLSLQEGAQLTGKSEMTIRRLTKKPGAKANTKKEEGKIYVSREWLLKHHPAINTEQATPEPIQKPIQESVQDTPEPIQPAYTTDYTALLAEREKRIEELASHLQQVNSLLEQERQQAVQDRQQAAREREKHSEETINFQKLLNNYHRALEDKEQALQEKEQKVTLLLTSHEQEANKVKELEQALMEKSTPEKDNTEAQEPVQQPEPEKQKPHSWWSRLFRKPGY